MRPTVALLVLLPALAGQAPPPDDRAAAARRERLLAVYRGEAAGYAIYRDSARREPVRLDPNPVYVWTNPVRGGEQDGAVFVWTCRGRADAIGTFFSYPAIGPRNLNHELHSLATTVLDVARPGGANGWTPRAPGIDPAPIEGAPAPARAAAARLLQIKALARDFAATTDDLDGRKWDLRMLPQPLHRTESTDPDVLDGALFAFVNSAGTDPELLLVIEARRPQGQPTAAPTWHYGLARFTDHHLVVRHKGREVLNVPNIPYDAPVQDAQHRYRSFRDRGIPAVDELPPAR